MGDASYNLAMGLPPCLICRILVFEIIEMSDLLPNSQLQEENQQVVTLDGQVLTASHTGLQFTTLLAHGCDAGVKVPG